MQYYAIIATASSYSHGHERCFASDKKINISELILDCTMVGVVVVVVHPQIIAMVSGVLGIQRQ